MTSETNICRLCLNTSQDLKPLYDETGRANELYDITINYFHPMILNMSLAKHLKCLCLQCWRHIWDFHHFQKSVVEAQEKLVVADDGVGVGEDDHIEMKMEAEECSLQNHCGQMVISTGEAVEEFISLIASKAIDTGYINVLNSDGFSQENDTQSSGKVGNERERNSLLGMFQDSEECHRTLSALRGGELDGDESMATIVENIASNRQAADDKDSFVSNESEIKLTDVHNSTNESNECQDKIEINIPNANDLSSRDYSMSKDEENDFIDKLIAKWLKCRVCQIPCTSYSSSRQHFDQRHPRSPFFYICCKRKISGRQYILQHLLVHEDPNAYKCEICGFCSQSAENIKSHLATIHAEIDPGFKLDGDYIIHCNKCDYSAYTTKAITEHKWNRHKLKWSFKCPECNEPFQNRQELHIHQNSEEGVKICRKKKFSTPTRVKITRASESARHTTGYQYLCTVCGKKFIMLRDLTKHRNSHTNAKMYLCEFCPQTFRLLHHRICHQRSQHFQMNKKEA